MAEETISGKLSGDRVLLGPKALPELYNQGYFGRPVGQGLELSLVEAAYLLDRSRIGVLSASTGSELDFQALFQISSSLEKGFEFRYVVQGPPRERLHRSAWKAGFPGLPARWPSWQVSSRVLCPGDFRANTFVP